MDYRVRVKELRAGDGHRLTGMPTGNRHVVVIGRNQAHLLEVDASVFSTNSSAPRPGAPGKPEPGREGCVQFAATALCYADAHPEQRILVSGHTDTVGGPVDNEELSLHRAKAMLALLEGDRETFGHEAHGPHVPDGEKTGVLLNDRIETMEWVASVYGWPTRLVDNYNDYFATVRSFQRSYNERGRAENVEASDLDVDADFGPNTWRAAFDCFRLEIAALLELTLDELNVLSSSIAAGGRWISPEKLTACGESQPIDNPGRDAYRSEANRRVEILFFDAAEEPDCPCFSGACAPEDCDLYKSSFYRRHPIPGSPFFGKLVIGWPTMVIDAIPPDLTLELSGASIPTQSLTLADSKTEDETTHFVFEQHDRSSPCTLRASAGGQTATLWNSQIVNPNRNAEYAGTIEELVAPGEREEIPPGEDVIPEEPESGGGDG